MDSAVRSAIRHILATGNVSSICSLAEAHELQLIIKDYIRKESQKTSVYYCTTHNISTNGVSCEFLGYASQVFKNKCERSRSTFYQVINDNLEKIELLDGPLPNNEHDYIAVQNPVFGYEDAESRILASYRIGSKRRNKIVIAVEKAAETKKKRGQNLRGC